MEQETRIKNKQIIGVSKISLLLLICVAEAFVLSELNRSEEYKFLFLLPLAYIASYLFFMPLIQRKCNYKRGYPYYVAQIVIAYRYLALPLSCIYTDYFGGWTITGANGFGVEPSSSAMASATLWMCTEVFFAELAIYIGTCITNKREKK